MFDLSRLTAAHLVATIDYHESLGSTSDRALALAAAGESPLPLLVLTDQQTAGRGRGANRWAASAGALTFSLALEAAADRLPPARWPLVALVAGLAACEALLEHAPAADLRQKWPNDILLDGRKLCGILSESVPGWRDRLVVGIGVNVNNDVSQVAALAPASSPLRSATSLLEHDRVPRDLSSVLLTILDHFDRRWQQLLAGQHALLLAAYRQRCFLTGRTVTMETRTMETVSRQQPAASRLVGRCLGIDDQGYLSLQTADGPRAVASGTVVAWEA